MVWTSEQNGKFSKSGRAHVSKKIWTTLICNQVPKLRVVAFHIFLKLRKKLKLIGNCIL